MDQLWPTAPCAALPSGPDNAMYRLIFHVVKTSLDNFTNFSESRFGGFLTLGSTVGHRPTVADPIRERYTY